LRATRRAELEAKKRAWEKANPEMVRMQAVRRRLRAQAVALTGSLRHHYNVTLDAYREIEQMQNRRCAICLTDDYNGRVKRPNVDHDHATGSLRALLCTRCNSALGYFRESPAALRRAAAYLEAFRAETSTDWPTRVRSVLAQLGDANG
jgi:hypothetical protein